MQGKSLECGLTQSQIKRILRGEELPAPLMADVEQHLKACDECQNFLDSTKLELAAQIASRTQTQPAAKKPAPAPTVPKRKPTKAAAEAYKQPSPPAGLKNGKTLALSIGLAAVLILMSTILRDPTKLFGPRAISSSLGEKALKVTEPDEVIKYTDEELEKMAHEGEEGEGHQEEEHAPADEHHEETPGDHEPEHREEEPAKPKPADPNDQNLLIAEGGETVTPHPKPEPEKPAAKPAAKPAPKPSTKRSTTRRTTTSTTKKAPASKPKTATGGGIKVYDKDGNPINP